MLSIEILHELGALLMSCRPMTVDSALHRCAIPESRNAPAPNSPMMVETQTLSAYAIPETRNHCNPISSGMHAALFSNPQPDAIPSSRSI
jgi:hypothetical protein